MADMEVSITKGKDVIVIDTDALPEDVYREALLQGLKVLLNRGMSKVTKSAYPGDEAGMKAKAMEIAAKNKADLLEGKVRKTGGKKSGLSGAVKTEAMRIARNIVKDELKRQKIKISHVDAKDITAAAKALMESEPEIVKQAEANLAERATVTIKGIDIAAIAKINPAKKAKDEAEKANKPLSAKQAGKTKARTKPGAQPTA